MVINVNVFAMWRSPLSSGGRRKDLPRRLGMSMLAMWIGLSSSLPD